MNSKDEAKFRLFDEKRNVTQKLSELIRYISFGLIAVVCSMLTTDSSILKSVACTYKIQLLVSIAIASLTIACDYFQYVFGYCSVRNALKNENNNYGYNGDSLCYRLWTWFFYIKQVTTGISIFVFGYIIVMSIMKL